MAKATHGAEVPEHEMRCTNTNTNMTRAKNPDYTPPVNLKVSSSNIV